MDIRARWARYGFATVLAVASIACTAKTHANAQHEDESYAVGGRTVRLKLRRDQIGVVLDEDAEHSELTDVLEAGTDHTPPHRNGFAADFLGGLHILDPAGTPDRDDLHTFARELVEKHPGVVEHAGMLVTPEGAKHPILLTHEIVVQFQPAADSAAIRGLVGRLDLTVIEESEFAQGLYLLETPRVSDTDALEACRLLARDPLVDHCEPNFVHHVEYLSQGLDDPLLHRQWHHHNDGSDGGTVDADIDTVEAWTITTGCSDVVIAITENGFDATHPDLLPNVRPPPDAPTTLVKGFGDGDPDDRGAVAHGTAVAGCAAAKGNNGIGVAGSCPDCSLMLLKRPEPTSYYADAKALDYAWANGADIISNSWTYGLKQPIPQVVCDAVDRAVTYGREGKGTVVLFAARNDGYDVNFWEDIVSIDGVLAVSAVTNTDERMRNSGYGVCIDLLGPTRLSNAPNKTQGTLNVATTDWRTMADGYNHDDAIQPHRNPGWPPCADLPTPGDYTVCFGGNSASTPIVAGVAGLLLSLNPDLTSSEVHYLLKNTTDLVEDSRASYVPHTGRSLHGEGEDAKNTHGHGRVNAYEAVRIVASSALGGRGGTDVVVRDNRLDWGNTEQPSHVLFEKERGIIGAWQSLDVLVDAPPYDGEPQTSVEFDARKQEEPAAGETNRVYVRVRNRGTAAATDVSVRLLWTRAASLLPALTRGELDTDPGTGAWHTLGVQTIDSIEHSGAGLAGGAEDAARIVTFDLVAPDDPEPFTFLVLVETDPDPLDWGPGPLYVPGIRVPRDNNATIYNVHRWDASAATWQMEFRVANPFPTAIETWLEGPTTATVEPVGTLPGFQAGQPFTLAAGAEVKLRVVIDTANAAAPIELLQKRKDGAVEELVGGMTFVPPQ